MAECYLQVMSETINANITERLQETNIRQHRTIW